MQPSDTTACSLCGQPLRPGARFCQSCGTTVSVPPPAAAQPTPPASTCPACAGSLRPGAKFCGNCGWKMPQEPAAGKQPVSRGLEQAVPVPAEEPAPGAAVQPAPPPSTCPVCAGTLRPGAKFCGSCGWRMPQEPPGAKRPEAPAPETATPQQPRDVPPPRSVERAGGEAILPGPPAAMAGSSSNRQAILIVCAVLAVALLAGGAYWFVRSRSNVATTASVTDPGSGTVAPPSSPLPESTPQPPSQVATPPVDGPNEVARREEEARLKGEKLAAETLRLQKAQTEAREHEQELEAQRKAFEERRVKQEEQQRQIEEARRRLLEEQERREREEQARANIVKEVPRGTTVTVRLIDGVDSERSKEGDTFRASLDAPLSIGGEVIAPKGTDATVRLAAARQAGTFRGRTELTVELVSITIGGKPVLFNTSSVSQTSGSQGAKTAKRAAAVGAVGAILGGIFGGGKGAAIGAGAGAAAGAGSQVLLGGRRVRIPSETVLTFATEGPVKLL